MPRFALTVGWDNNGRYYTRSRRVNGRVVREYVGKGEAGEAAHRADQEAKRRKRAALLAEQAALRDREAPLELLDDLCDLLLPALLNEAGYFQHKRGEWRKRRPSRRAIPETREPDGSNPALPRRERG